jgi:RND family efflux transporter MFP subunit
MINKVLRLIRPRMSWKYALIVIVVAGITGYLVKRVFFPSTDGFEISEVQRGKVEEVYILTGAVNADEYAQLAFPASGKIAWIDVIEGEEVLKGQRLAQLDTTTLNSAFEAAKSDLRIADAEALKVLDDLKNKGNDETFAEKDTRTLAEASKDKAYEAFLVAEYNLRNSILVAPFSGIVTSVVNPFAGVNITAGQTQIELINPETIYFELSADQTEVTTIRMGDKVRIELDADSEKMVEGEVVHISYTPRAGEVGIVYPIRIKFVDIEDGGIVLRVGMTGDAIFVLDSKDDVLWVSSDFIKSDEEGDYVLINNGQDKLYVEVGIEGEDRVEISGDGVVEGLTIYD